MSLKLFKLFVNKLRLSLPKYPKPGVQSRYIVAMDVKECLATAEVKEPTKDATVENRVPIVHSKNLTRFKKRLMKRQWEDSTIKEKGETDEKKDKTERIKRKKMAMLLGYCGVDYYGMQRNPGVQTIEGDLFKALFDAKYILEDDFKNQQNTQFQRSSRTDKGVSAARQVVSLKLPLEVNADEINKRLPPCIRVFGIKRVTNKFNSKVQCNARTYTYTLPAFVFDPSLETEEERNNYRLDAEKSQKIMDILDVYKGTKNYHNFTEKKHPTDPSAHRYIMCFKLEKVFLERDIEFAVLSVKGQSFMLHQIRKMVGLMLAVIRGQTDMSMLEKVFKKDKVITPTAPGLGLVLDMVHYDSYDSKFKKSHDNLTWAEHETAVDKFKHEYIYPNIIKGEIEGQSMAKWLHKLATHSYEPSEYVAGDKDDVDDNGDDDNGGDDNGGDDNGGDDKRGDDNGGDDKGGDDNGGDDKGGDDNGGDDKGGDVKGGDDKKGVDKVDVVNKDGVV